MNTITLVDGYSRTKTPRMLTFRAITLDEVKSWAIGEDKKCYHDVPANSLVETSPVSGLEVKRWNCECWNAIHPYHSPKCEHFICGKCNVMIGGLDTYHVDTTPSHIWFRANDGKARQCKVNGKVRTWKRDQNRIELPVKYGLYEYAVFTTTDIENGRLLELISE